MTRIELASSGNITEEMEEVARAEGVSPGFIRDGLKEGTMVITCNRERQSTIKPLAVGRGLRTKVNANIGTSTDREDPQEELLKLKVAIESGADSVMDLSTGGDIDGIRKMILRESTVPVGTVPVYQAAFFAKGQGKSFVELAPEEFIEMVARHASDGVDFVTVHCGIRLSTLERLKKDPRLMGIVSRGGALMAEWMRYNKRENPFYERFDELVAIAKRYDMVLSLGDALRPGCLRDATDGVQIEELMTLGELRDVAHRSGVGVMIEGPGHVPIDEIEANVLLEKRLCSGAPFYVLGPLVTDIGAGYDHITSAIGGAIAASKGADFLCYVTPGEHLRLPTIEDVKEGVIAARIAAHAGDIAKKVPGAVEKDVEMSLARRRLDWETQIRLSVDPQRAREFRSSRLPEDENVCTMCGALCAIKIDREGLGQG